MFEANHGYFLHGCGCVRGSFGSHLLSATSVMNWVAKFHEQSGDHISSMIPCGKIPLFCWILVQAILAHVFSLISFCSVRSQSSLEIFFQFCRSKGEKSEGWENETKMGHSFPIQTSIKERRRKNHKILFWHVHRQKPHQFVFTVCRWMFSEKNQQ